MDEKAPAQSGAFLFCGFSWREKGLVVPRGGKGLFNMNARQQVTSGVVQALTFILVS